MRCDQQASSALTSDKTSGAGDGATVASACSAASVLPAGSPAGGAAEVAGASMTVDCSGSVGNLAAGKVVLLTMLGESASSAGTVRRQRSGKRLSAGNILHCAADPQLSTLYPDYP